MSLALANAASQQRGATFMLLDDMEIFDDAKITINTPLDAIQGLNF